MWLESLVLPIESIKVQINDEYRKPINVTVAAIINQAQLYRCFNSFTMTGVFVKCGKYKEKKWFHIYDDEFE